MYLIYISISIPIILFLWEHIAIVCDKKIKPTYFIDMITYLLQKFWYNLGMFYAYIGTWIEHIYFHKLYLTSKSFVDSIVKLFASIKYFKKGFNKIISVYKSGRDFAFYSSITILIVAMLCIAINNYCNAINNYIKIFK